MAEVYVITNKINGKQYVGKTNRTSTKRFQEHVRESEENYSNGRILYKAIRKYGEDNFLLEVLHKDLTPDEANDLEIKEIKNRNTFQYGYNSTIGGDGTTYVLVTEESIENLIYLYVDLGYSIKKISELVKADVHTISDRLKENGIKISPRANPREVIEMTIPKGDVIMFNHIDEVVIFLKENSYTDAKENRVKEGIRRALTGKRDSYLKCNFKQINTK